MDYEEACEATVSREQARREIARHDIDGTFADFLREVGDRDEYTGAQVVYALAQSTHLREAQR